MYLETWLQLISLYNKYWQLSKYTYQEKSLNAFFSKLSKCTYVHNFIIVQGFVPAWLPGQSNTC